MNLVKLVSSGIPYMFFFLSFAIDLVANTYSSKHTHGKGECGDLGSNPKFHIKYPHNQTTRL